MRRVLYGAVVALLLMAAIAAERHFDGGTGYGGSGRSVDILAFSAGEGLEPAIYKYRSRVPEAAIFVGDLTLTDRRAGPGIRVATFGPDFDFHGHEVFDITREEQAAKLVDHCQSQPDNTLMILTTKGSVYVPPDEKRCFDTAALRLHSVALYYFDPGQISYRARLRDQGWYGMERSTNGAAQAWTRGTTSELWIEVREPGPGSLYVRCYGLHDQGGRRTLEVTVAGRSLGKVELPDRPTTLSWDIPEGLLTTSGLHKVVLETDRFVRRGGKGSKRPRDLGAMVDFVALVSASSTVARLDKDPFDTEARTILDRYRRVELTRGFLGGCSLDVKWRAERCVPSSELVVAVVGKESPTPVYEERLPAGVGTEATTLLLPSDLPTHATLRLSLEGPGGSAPEGKAIVDSLCLRPARSDALEQLFDDLGTRARPFVEQKSSWAMISLRRPQGWINLAEAFSIDQGITLAFTIGRNWAAYDRHRTEYVVFAGEDTGPHAGTTLNTGGLTSPFNDKELKPGGAAQGFSFLAAGHLYGAPQNQGSELVPDRLLASVATLNQQGADFFMALGDIVRSPTPRRLELFRSVFASELDMPLFNAVGNHDIGGPQTRGRYTRAFGDTFYHFVHKRAAFVVLDTELTGAEIKGEQLALLRAVLDRARRDPGIHNVFVCSHKLLWCVNRPDLSTVFEHLNSSKGYATSRNFVADILPILRSTATVKPVYWLSGDVGVSWSLPVIFAHEDDVAITYVGVGIGDTDRDAVLRCMVDPNGQVSFKLISLAEKTPQPVAAYNVDFWRHHFER